MRLQPLAFGHEGAHLGPADGRFDALWERERGDYDITGVRDAAFLRWRYDEFPSARHYTIGLTSRRSGALTGFVIYRGLGGGRAHVADLFCEQPARQLEALLLCLVRALRAAGYASVALDVIADERLSARLRRPGFLRRPQARSFVVHPLGLERAELEAATDPRRWHIVDGDLDI